MRAWLWPVVTVVWVGQAAFWAIVDQPVLVALTAAAAAASGFAAGRERAGAAGTQLDWGRRADSRRR